MQNVRIFHTANDFKLKKKRRKYIYTKKIDLCDLADPSYCSSIIEDKIIIIIIDLQKHPFALFFFFFLLYF